MQLYSAEEGQAPEGASLHGRPVLIRALGRLLAFLRDLGFFNDIVNLEMFLLPLLFELTLSLLWDTSVSTGALSVASSTS